MESRPIRIERFRANNADIYGAAQVRAHGSITPTRCEHVNHASLKKQHTRAFREANADLNRKADEAKAQLREQGKEAKLKPAQLEPWVLYSFRHTFLTRLGESGCDAWTLARIAGHSSIAISSRYIHPSDDAVLNAMSRRVGANLGTVQK